MNYKFKSMIVLNAIKYYDKDIMFTMVKGEIT